VRGLVWWRVGEEEERSRRTRWAGGGWVGEVEAAKVRSRSVYLEWSGRGALVGPALSEVCCAERDFESTS
jgi:hypothetical protein